MSVKFFKAIISSLLLFSFSFLNAQDSTKYITQTIKKDTLKDTINHWKYFVFMGGGKGYCDQANGTAFTGSYSVAYKSHLLSLSGGGSYTPYSHNPSNGSYFNYGYIGLLFGERLKYKNLLGAISVGLAYTNLQYTETDLRTYAIFNGYMKTGLTLPVELKLAALSRKNFGIGINVSTNFTLSSRYAPLLVTASFVFGNWNPKNKTKRS